jgi:hypothetical protein
MLKHATFLLSVFMNVLLFSAVPGAEPTNRVTFRQGVGE